MRARQTTTALRSLALAAILGAACSSRPGGGSALPSEALAGRCAAPRPGTSDQQGTLADEKAWLRAWTDDLYLWYREVPPSNPDAFPTAAAYFAVLKTPALTPSGAPKDQFHFSRSTAEWELLSRRSAEVGYGMELVLLSERPPRSAVVAQVEPGAAAALAGIARGTEILAVDGAAVVDGDPAVLNAGLFPAAADETHTLTVRDAGASTSRAVTLVSAVVSTTPVRSAVLTSPGGRKVGYVLMNDQLQAAEGALASAIGQLRADAVQELVLDLRYNGGGYLLVASQAAYMISGFSGGTFERTIFNDRYPGFDPVSGEPVSLPFYPYRYFSAPAGAALPTLGLDRVVVLTGRGTASASESLLNGLAGIGRQVVQIGATTRGKPYGFYPWDNCGTTWFSIQFQGVNALGFGDYADGFSPGGSGPASFPGCAVADDFLHALGDPAEARLAAALGWLDTGACPTPGAAPAVRSLASAEAERGWLLPRSPLRELRLPLPR